MTASQATGRNVRRHPARLRAARVTAALGVAMAVTATSLATAAPAHASWSDAMRPLSGHHLALGQVSLTADAAPAWVRPDGSPFRPGTDVAAPGDTLIATVPFTVVASGSSMAPALAVQGLELPTLLSDVATLHATISEPVPVRI